MLPEDKPEAKFRLENVGQIQAREIKARRHHRRQTCRPTKSIHLCTHYHASFLFSSRASAYCAQFTSNQSVLCKEDRQKNCSWFESRKKKPPLARCLSWSDNCSLNFGSTHTVSVKGYHPINCYESCLLLEECNIRRQIEKTEYKTKNLKILAGSEGSIGFYQSEGLESLRK